MELSSIHPCVQNSNTSAPNALARERARGLQRETEHGAAVETILASASRRKVTNCVSNLKSSECT
eukprot:6197364-Pleurochrysis_carterae.AAC.1